MTWLLLPDVCLSDILSASILLEWTLYFMTWLPLTDVCLSDILSAPILLGWTLHFMTWLLLTDLCLIAWKDSSLYDVAVTYRCRSK